MYFFIDESGHTGPNLFDEHQPTLYYGVLSSSINIDNLASDAVKELRGYLGVERLHANELGLGRLVDVSKALIVLQQALSLRFDFHSVQKLDHALICFFDQVFDNGINPAVPWTSYWTPLRYMLLFKVAALFDLETLKLAWSARIQPNDIRATRDLCDVCGILLSRFNETMDKRSRQIIGDALTWAIQNPEEIRYNAKNKQELYWITPNLIGFQTVLHGIAWRIKNESIKSTVIVVDQQSQFNQTQRSLAEFYAEVRELRYDIGTGLPEIDFTGMPVTPIVFRSGKDSVGLELVDLYLWLFKKLRDGKEIPLELQPLIDYQMEVGITNEISLGAIAERWSKWFSNLPEPSPEELEAAQKLINDDELKRLKLISASKQRKQLG